MSQSADEAASSLRELDTLTDRTRAASRSMATGVPLVAWGIVWIVGLAALEMLDGLARVTIMVAAWLTAVLTSWLPKRAVIRTGTETRMRWAWIVVLTSSPFLTSAARPTHWVHAVLLLCALWGLAMCLYAVATGDRVLAVVAGIGIVGAGLAGIPHVSHPLMSYGVVAGLPMVLLGLWRVLHGVRHV